MADEDTTQTQVREKVTIEVSPSTALRLKSPVKYGPRCQHPSMRSEGLCGNKSIQQTDVPDDYAPDRRHVKTPDIARPQAWVCRAHLSKIEAFKKGIETPIGAHETQCGICQHPDQERVMRALNLWTSWAVSITDVCRDLCISVTTFHNHVEHFNLWSKKLSVNATGKALGIAAERGFAAGGHNVRTALQAVHQIHQQRNLPKVTNHNVRAAVGVFDMSKMTPQQLATLAAELSQQFEELPPGEVEGEDES